MSFLGSEREFQARNSRSKGSETEKCKVHVVNNREPNVTVTNYERTQGQLAGSNSLRIHCPHSSWNAAFTLLNRSCHSLL